MSIEAIKTNRLNENNINKVCQITGNVSEAYEFIKTNTTSFGLLFRGSMFPKLETEVGMNVRFDKISSWTKDVRVAGKFANDFISDLKDDKLIPVIFSWKNGYGLDVNFFNSEPIFSHEKEVLVTHREFVIDNVIKVHDIYHIQLREMTL